MSPVEQRIQQLDRIMKSKLSTENLEKLARVIESVDDPNKVVPKIEKFISSPIAKTFL